MSAASRTQAEPSAGTMAAAPRRDALPTLFVDRAPAHRRTRPWPGQGRVPLKDLPSSVPCRPATRTKLTTTRRGSGSSRTDASPAVRLDQYYTRPGVAARCYRIVSRFYDTAAFLLVEPSAGTGVFARLLLPESLAYDLEPKHPLVQRGDFLEITVPHGRRVMVIGNPPFGRGSRMALRFFNHAASFAEVIAMIVPRTFRKASIENRLDSAFHLVFEETVTRDAFTFNGKVHDVPTMFQVWERREEARPLRSVEITHPDFTFVEPGFSDFAIRRIGVWAGRIHRDRNASASSHYFIRGDAEAVMRKLDLAGAAADTAGVPSLAKSEIVALYRRHVEGQKRR